MTLRLAIDAGHGGDITPPAFAGLTNAEKLQRLGRRRGCMVGGLPEADYALSLSRYLASTIRHWEDDVAGYLIRTGHEDDLSWNDRGFRASEFDADLTYSLHVNSFERSELRGAIMFHCPGDDAGRDIAETLAMCWPRPLRRDVAAGAIAAAPSKGAWLQRVHNVISVHDMPAVLIECGFASNPKDLEALHSPATQTAMVWAMMCGVARLRKLKELSCEP